MKILLLTTLLVGCGQMQSKKGVLANKENLEESKETIDVVSLKKAITKKFPKARNIVVESQFLNSVSLFWSNPGYVEGPTLNIYAKCWKISFTTNTFNDDGSLRYTDDYEYYVLKEDSIAFQRNRYHGKGYHGGYFIMVKNEVDFRYNDLRVPLVSSKDDFIIALESILKK